MAVADYETATSIRVRLYDDSPTGRGESAAEGQTETGPPPPPVVSIYKSAACDDQDDVETNDCNIYGYNAGCQYNAEGTNRCGFLGIQVSGAREGLTCRVTQHDDGILAPRRDDMRDVVNGNTATQWLFDSGRVGVTCSGGSGSKAYSVVAYMDWP